MNSRGKRMVQEDELTYLQELKAAHSDPSAEWGGGGSSLEAGAGIDITEGVLSVDYGAGLTVDDGTLVVDASTVAMKSDLATVATTGSYSDLTGTPTIPDVPSVIELSSSSGTLTAEQLASIQMGSQIILTESEVNTYSLIWDIPWSGQYIFINVKGYVVLAEQYPMIQTQYPILAVDKTTGSYWKSTNTMGEVRFEQGVIVYEKDPVFNSNILTTAIKGGVYKQYALDVANFTYSSPIVTCTDDKLNYYFAYRAIDVHTKYGWTGFDTGLGTDYSTSWSYISFATSTSGDDITFTIDNNETKPSGTWFTYNTSTGVITPGTMFDRYAEDLYTNHIDVSDQNYFKILDPDAEKKAGMINPIDAKFVPVDGTTITVDSNGKLAATGGSGGKYLHKVQIRCKASGTSLVFDDFVVTNSATAYTSAEDYLTDQGYTITTTSSDLTNYLTCMQSGSMVSIAVMSGVAYRADISVDTTGDIVKSGNWSLVSGTVGITDTVMPL